ncbi:amino acid transporter [Pseudohyphozyma bogoriensis]|nr:amino acid transporter [Pseudohyphozyma bogoriensis]
MASMNPALMGVADAGVVEPTYSKDKKEGDFNVSETSYPSAEAQSNILTGNISLVEYMHWATLRRAEEDEDTGATTAIGIAAIWTKKDKDAEKTFIGSESDLDGLSPRDRELANARRVLRQAGWATVGPFNAPYSIASIGMAPGICLYILFGLFAILGGFMLCKIFLRLDSVRYPVIHYGDMAERIFGKWAKHGCSILQSIQLVLNVGLICLSNGQSLSQMSNARLCFSVCVVVWAICGMILGQIRGLQNFGKIANVSVWLNLLLIFLSMGFVAHSPPNYAAAYAASGVMEGPVEVTAVVSLPVFSQVNGVFNMVFAYGGAMIFPELMAEMRRPKDFIRGMALAQGLIMSVYLLYGIFLSRAAAYQGVSKYAWQTIGNAIALVTGIIAAGLYGNIGLKVFYANIVEGLFKGPPIMSRSGAFLWSFLVIVYWALAFVIGSAIPSLGTLSGLVAAACIFHFTYTFPPLLMLGLDIGIDAAAGDEEFTTPGVTPRRVDSWRQLSRWQRGIFGGGRKRTIIKFANLLYFLAALATAGMGLWATGTDLDEALKAGAATSFGCAAPV